MQTNYALFLIHIFLSYLSFSTSPSILLLSNPIGNPYWQQKLWSWDPVMTPTTIVVMFLLLGIIFLPVGTSITGESNDLFQKKVVYGGNGQEIPCAVKDQACTVSIVIDKDMDGPLYVYYEIENFYQNNIRYSANIPWDQLIGTQPADIDETTLETYCDPLTKNGDMTLYPCGLVANSFFNDTITLTASGSTINGQSPAVTQMSSTNINLGIYDDLFKQVDGYESATVSTCTGHSCSSLPSGRSTGCECYDGPLTTTPYIYYYPDDDTTQYLHETYPTIISPEEGVTNVHFKNWMNIAALPNFLKLYGHIGGPFKKGDVLEFNVESYFDANDFDGSKSIFVSEQYALGLPNGDLGTIYVVSGAICLVVAVIFLLKQLIAPRPIGSPATLNWK